MQVIRFTTEDEIKEFHSCLGNNSVPYEFAVGDRYTYFILEGVKMENEKILKHRAERSARFTVDAKSNRLGLNKFRAVCGHVKDSDGGQSNAWDLISRARAEPLSQQIHQSPAQGATLSSGTCMKT